jgi:hypothetical protein
MTRASISIPFELTPDDDSLTLELDDERNAGVSSFGLGATAWIRAITDEAIAVKGSTRGSLGVDRLHLRFEEEEDLSFVDTDRGALRYLPLRIISHNWLGRGLGNVTFDHKTVQAAQEGYGILRVKYEVAYASLKLEGVAEEGPVLIWAEDAAGRQGSLNVPFGEREGGEELVTVTVKSYCTDFPIPGASVWVDGQFKGTTDGFGRLTLGKYAAGEHTIKAAAPGYKDSDIDGLANDSFRVG